MNRNKICQAYCDTFYNYITSITNNCLVECSRIFDHSYDERIINMTQSIGDLNTKNNQLKSTIHKLDKDIMYYTTSININHICIFMLTIMCIALLNWLFNTNFVSIQRKIHQISSDTDSIKVCYNSELCMICIDKKSNIIYKPCNHNIICEDCNGMLTRKTICPYCAQNIQAFQKINIIRID